MKSRIDFYGDDWDSHDAEGRFKYGAGKYYLKRQCDSHEYGLTIEALYTPSEDADKPVALILPGYRGNALAGDNNVRLADTFSRNGSPVVQMNYSGFDNTYSWADVATLATNAVDFAEVREAISNTPELSYRDLMVVANSYSANVAFKDENPAALDGIKSIVCVSPFPNMVAEGVDEILNLMPQWHDDLEAKGHFVLDPELVNLPLSVPKKFTKAFVESARHRSMFVVADLARFSHKPEVQLVRYAQDSVVPDGLVGRWVDTLSQAGYKVTDDRIPGCDHHVTDEMLEVFRQRLAAVVPG